MAPHAEAKEIAAAKKKIAEESAKLDAAAAQERQKRIEAEIALEEKALSHRVAMGRVSMQEEIRQQEAAMRDPWRSLDQQRQAEKELYDTKIQYAQNYFKLYESIGRPQWAEEIKSATDIVATSVAGSEKWFQAVDKVKTLYQEIHDKAKGIAGTLAGIAEEEARKQGRTRISKSDIPALLESVRRRDAAILAGGTGDVGR